MRLTIKDAAIRLGITKQDMHRLIAGGVVDPPIKDTDGLSRFDNTSTKLITLLALTPEELRARGIVNTSQLFKGAS